MSTFRTPLALSSMANRMLPWECMIVTGTETSSALAASERKSNSAALPSGLCSVKEHCALSSIALPFMARFIFF